MAMSSTKIQSVPVCHATIGLHPLGYSHHCCIAACRAKLFVRVLADREARMTFELKLLHILNHIAIRIHNSETHLQEDVLHGAIERGASNVHVGILSFFDVVVRKQLAQSNAALFVHGGTTSVDA